MTHETRASLALFASVAAIMGVVALFLWGLQPVNQILQDLRIKTTVATGDDQPITMAGGSLYFSTTAGYYFQSDGSHQLKHSDQSRYVDGVDVTDKSDLTTSTTYSNQAVKIEMVYCDYTPPSGGTPSSCANTETVTFNTGGNGKGLTLQSVVSSGKPTYMDTSPRLTVDPTLYSHPRRQKKITKISINGTQVASCEPKGECAVIIHYCTVTSGCVFR